MFRARYLLALLAVAYLLTGVYQVGPDERAVVRRFGQVVARPGPGLGFGLPWGVDRVDRIPVRTVRQLRVGYDPGAGDTSGSTGDSTRTPAGQMLTGDQNLVNVQLVIDYAIGEADQDLDDYTVHRELVDATLTRAAEAAAAEWAGGRTIDHVLLTGSSALPAWVMDRLGERLPELRLGVRVQRASVALLTPPDEVRSAFEAVTQAQTAIGTKETQARQERDQRLSQAAATRYKLEQEARQFRDEQRAQGRADAAAFLDERAAFRTIAKTNPDARALLWWNEIQETLDAITTHGGRAEPIDHYLVNGELNLYAIFDFFSPPRR
ncbi:SPFH domain-containing protein [Frigoriglobus tundricola]|uniref:HflK protein n=1 Tax=Frigoriglobus tundricola TaxID=2774151 RepID=A0A6M5YV28_9BACT|nr:SPFH domain-containing protein [Frigoriglobus tundricola]QJW97320.1 HflK protein [Frigoriglobus tundricola]